MYEDIETDAWPLIAMADWMYALIRNIELNMQLERNIIFFLVSLKFSFGWA